MSTKAMAGNTSSKIILLAAIAAGVYGASMVFTNLVPGVAESWGKHRARIAADNARIDAIRNDGYELYYANVCGDYFDADFIDKHWRLRKLAWCADYEDRMPHPTN
jgi:hypothetical protein